MHNFPTETLQRALVEDTVEASGKKNLGSISSTTKSNACPYYSIISYLTLLEGTNGGDNSMENQGKQQEGQKVKGGSGNYSQ